MTEREKMLSGELYRETKELLEERVRTKEILYDLHALRPGETEKQEALLRKLLGKVGKEFHIESPFHCDYGYNIEIGDYFYANFNATFLDGAKITIGDYVLLGPNVSLFTAGHPTEVSVRRDGLEYARPITIGNDVWIGGGSILNPGVTIGSGTVIGSGSVVTKDIPAGVVAAGVPCRVLGPAEQWKSRCPRETEQNG